MLFNTVICWDRAIDTLFPTLQGGWLAVSLICFLYTVQQSVFKGIRAQMKPAEENSHKSVDEDFTLCIKRQPVYYSNSNTGLSRYFL